MKFVSFIDKNKDTWGIVKDEYLIGVDEAMLQEVPTLRSAISQGKLMEVGQELVTKSGTVSLDQAKFLPVITNPEKILCVGLNYHEHRLEGGHDEVGNPTIFVRFANAQIGHNAPMIKPKESDTLDFEAELAVIIGTGGRRISEENAFSHIAGYSCYNDGSVREFQRHTTQFTPGKNFIGTGGFGPWMVTPDEIADLQNVSVESR